jgi:glycerol uptake facilitator-like aquaporin
MQDTVPYVVAQVVGAILASLIIGGVVVGTMGEGGLGGTGLGLNMMGEQIEPWKGLLMELVMTAALVFVIFGAAMDKRGLGNIAPLAVGFTVVIISLVAIPLTGASVNPARSLAPALVGNAWAGHWIYWVGPLVGAGAMGYAYKFLFQNNSND